MSSQTSRYVVVGGGIAGVSCAETLKTISSNESAEILLLSSSSLVKSVSNLSQITQNLIEFQVKETPINEFAEDCSGIKIKCCEVTKIKPKEHVVVIDRENELSYTKLCVCTGARPKLIDQTCPYLIGIRDTETVKDLEVRLKSAKKIVVVGNGGIAMELVYALRDVEVVWVIRDKSIGTTFLDCGAAEYLVSELQKTRHESEEHLKPDARRSKYTVFNLSDNTSTSTGVASGSALGPDWHEHALLKGSSTSNWSIEYECEVQEIVLKSQMPETKREKEDWPVYAALTNGKTVGCDFIVSATGVFPNSELFQDLECTIVDDGGVKVDDNMRVIGLQDVYAAGDVCTTSWKESPHWQQMRLWTQARQMGIFSAQCMVSHTEMQQDAPLDFCFEIFTHVTRFFGHKVVLLGKFNGQGIDKADTQLIVRVTPSKEYVKVVLKNGRMFGAVLVGETDLEETFENLILNGMDLSHYGENLLHPNVDLEDYFD